MTLFAGIFSRHAGEPLPDSACEALRRGISRHPTDEVHAIQNERCFFVKVDIGAFSEPAFDVAADGSISLLAGEPLLSVDNGLSQGRTKDLELLHESWKHEDWAKLKSARGVFCAAHYQPTTGKLFLISDKLGIRPLYYWANEKFVIFATALRVLEFLDEIPKEMDLRGVTEMTGLGYPLGSRTPYANVSLLKAAEIVEFTEKKIARRLYWRWDEIKPSREPEAELLQEAHQVFMQAVARRNAGDTTTIAYLSGGLDSRCAVAALRELETRVHTFNFSLPGTQDYVFGNEYARRAHTIHEAVPKEEGDLTPDYSLLMARAWRDSKRREELPAERACLVWSGEGGSVAFGHVHLIRSIVELMRAGRIAEAVETFLQQEEASVTRRLLQEKARDVLGEALHAGIREELDDLNCADPARSFYLFLMLNDQRRKLSAHFENIDLHRLEFQLPFFDAEFLAQVIRLPLDWCLGHRFYTKWLELFPPPVTSVAWQTYPGHEPCPVPAPEGMAYQWDDAYQAKQRALLKRELLSQSARMLKAHDFPKEILQKSYLKIASLIYQTGLRDYSYVIQSAWKYYTYWNLCGGKYVLSSAIELPASSTNNSRAQHFNAGAKLTPGAVE
jgi:hypothetical protein